jgi:hypothetical protein
MDCGCVQVGVNEGFDNESLVQHYSLEEIYTFNTTFSLKLYFFRIRSSKWFSCILVHYRQGHRMATTWQLQLTALHGKFFIY